jgi:hypothetical protein
MCLQTRVNLPHRQNRSIRTLWRRCARSAVEDIGIWAAQARLHPGEVQGAGDGLGRRCSVGDREARCTTPPALRLHAPTD